MSNLIKLPAREDVKDAPRRRRGVPLALFDDLFGPGAPDLGEEEEDYEYAS